MNNIFKNFLLASVLAFFAPYLFAQESAAQKAYNQGDYLQAAQIYTEQLKSAQKPSAALYYNLANSYYKLGLTPRAIANYYRAWRLNPRDKDIRHNLSFVMAQNGQSLIPGDVPASAFHLFFYLSIIELEGLLWLLGWLFVIVFIFVLISDNRKLKKVLICLGVGILFVGAWYLARRPFDTKHLAVISVNQAEVRSGPGLNFPVNLSVPRNNIVQVKDTKDNWTQILIPQANAQGWVLKEDLEEI
ncbi:MAG: hypothetical protein II972_03195 [Elusimicrobiaceae bacterium]|nr:hypothetical protein [Elusimicrobiaceae bacterium]